MRRRNFPRNNSRFAHAGHSHSALAPKQQLHRPFERAVEPCHHLLNRLRFDAQHSPCSLKAHKESTSAALIVLAAQYLAPFLARSNVLEKAISFPIPRTYQRRKLLQSQKQSRKLIQWQRIRSVRERLCGILVRLQKNSVHACCNSRSRQRLDKFRLSATRMSLPAGELHRMRNIEDHWISIFFQNRERPKIHHQILVTE